MAAVTARSDGSLLVANLYDNSGVYTPAHLLPGSSAPGIPTINWNGGGINATIQYDSCWSLCLKQITSLQDCCRAGNDVLANSGDL